MQLMKLMMGGTRLTLFTKTVAKRELTAYMRMYYTYTVLVQIFEGHIFSYFRG